MLWLVLFMLSFQCNEIWTCQCRESFNGGLFLSGAKVHNWESWSGLKVMKSELWERKSEESNLHPDVAQMSSVGDLKPVFCLTQQSCLFLSGGITIKTKSTRPHKTRLFLCWSQTSLRTNSLISSWYRLCWYKIIILSYYLSYYCNKYLIWSNWLNTTSWTLSSRTQNWTPIT